MSYLGPYTVQPTPDKLRQWDADLALWELDQVSPFFVDPDTNQEGAICVGRDAGAVSYFRAL